MVELMEGQRKLLNQRLNQYLSDPKKKNKQQMFKTKCKKKTKIRVKIKSMALKRSGFVVSRLFLKHVLYYRIYLPKKNEKQNIVPKWPVGQAENDASPEKQSEVYQSNVFVRGS